LGRTAEGSVNAAVEALKQGAADFLQKPIDANRLRGLVNELLLNGPAVAAGDHAVQATPEGQPIDSDLRPATTTEGWFEGMLGRSGAMRSLFDAIERVARTEAPVLIVGESGSGKELVARVGGRKEHIADVRVIAATNRDLLTLVQDNKFREDLYFRLNVFSIVLPPLRERREDIIPLAEHYLHRFAQRYGTPVRRLGQGAIERLLNYPWPGNIRRLRNLMGRAAAFGT